MEKEKRNQNSQFAKIKEQFSSPPIVSQQMRQIPTMKQSHTRHQEPVDPLMQVALEEYRDLFEKILIIPQNDFIPTLSKYIEITLKKNKIKYNQNSLEKILKIITTDYYETERAKLLTSIQSLGQPIKFKSNNFISHCNMCSSPIHVCGNPFYELTNKYLICLKCKEVYDKKCVLFYCKHCKVDYYSEVKDSDRIERYQPATWQEYHCKLMMNDTMKCIKCKNILYINLDNGKLACLKCKKDYEQSSIKWICILCKKEFSCEAKVYNPLEFKTVKIAIKKTLFDQEQAYPEVVPCCKIKKEDMCKYNFTHKKACEGKIYLGYLNGKKIVVCNICYSLYNYEQHMWYCPLCNHRFKVTQEDIMNAKNEAKNNNNESQEQGYEGSKIKNPVNKPPEGGAKSSNDIRSSAGLIPTLAGRANYYNKKFNYDIKNTEEKEEDRRNNKGTWGVPEKNYTGGMGKKYRDLNRNTEECADNYEKEGKEIERGGKVNKYHNSNNHYGYKGMQLSPGKNTSQKQGSNNRESNNINTNKDIDYDNSPITFVQGNRSQFSRTMGGFNISMKSAQPTSSNIVDQNDEEKDLLSNPHVHLHIDTQQSNSKNHHRAGQISNNVEGKSMNNIVSVTSLSKKVLNQNGSKSKYQNKNQSNSGNNSQKSTLNSMNQQPRTTVTASSNVDSFTWMDPEQPDIPTFDSQSLKVIRLLGQGTFAKTYEVEKNGYHYALRKVIISSDEELTALLSECRLIRSLSKDKINLVTIHAVHTKVLDSTTQVMYVLMDLAVRDWEKEIEIKSSKREPYKEDELLKILKELTHTFAELQRHNISHRDIKPQNILVFPDKTFRIADFGEAKRVLNKGDRNDAMKQTIRGTELYMSPILFNALKTQSSQEMYTEHNTYKSDVFSLGLCFILAASLTFRSINSIRELQDMITIKLTLNKYLSGKYSGKFIDILYSMIEINESSRCDFVQLEQYLSHFK